MIGESLVVVADAHLGATDSHDEEAFLSFLDQVPAMGDSLLLAGDIYDFWFTYKRLIPRKCFRVTARILELARRTPVMMIGGNHDRWGDVFWTPDTGVTFDPRQLRFRLGTRDVLAIHGDGVHKEHRVAAILNRVLNSPATIAAFAALPASIGFRVAKGLGHDPAFAAAHPEVIDIAVERQATFAVATMQNDPALSALIMGHTHRAALIEVSSEQRYVNPGPWLHERRYAIVTPSGARLAHFS